MQGRKKFTEAMAWFLQVVAVVMLVPPAFFKLTGAANAVAMFDQLGAEPWGRIAVALAELVAVALLLIPSTAFAGGLLTVGLMVGAISSHLTVLGISGDGGQLFVRALVALVAGGGVAALRWSTFRWRLGAAKLEV